MGVMPKRDKTVTDFGRNVSRLRSDVGLSQDKLVERFDLKPQMTQMDADANRF
jgi:ribosome-binding protein aMBF1 (putative translation factor)